MATNQLEEYMKGKKCEGFTPHPYYSREGDFLTYSFTDDDFYAHRVDDTLTVFLSMVENEFVGFKLKGVRNLLDTLGEFAFRVTTGDGNIMLGLLFWAGMQRTENYLAIEYYQQGAERTKTVPINRRELQPVEA
jgi:hypothetical protein